ncbi:MAG: M23 family metallopeptidase [Crocinitomicaceae bacterium]|nr:M23 family metallopeptidase [Crocinitomicaceae bacterium]
MKLPVNGRITSRFGNRGSGFHNGLDIAVPQGTPVLAPKSGTVKNVYSNTQGGNQLIIDHTQGFRTGYAHLSKSVVSIGQKIRKGQVIAYSGNTGHSTGPHLHLTLRKNGELVNPEDYFGFA